MFMSLGGSRICKSHQRKRRTWRHGNLPVRIPVPKTPWRKEEFMTSRPTASTLLGVAAKKENKSKLDARVGTS
jgi:ribosomal protein L11